MTGLPSTATASDSFALSPSLAIWPLSVTRPASIQPSISLREPSPAAASSFCSRSPRGSAVGAGGGLLGLLSLFFGTDSRFRGGGTGFKCESLRDFRERRQLLEGAQA